eukprot:984423-Lingulodinium_polyedra.AAC.1
MPSWIRAALFCNVSQKTGVPRSARDPRAIRARFARRFARPGAPRSARPGAPRSARPGAPRSARPGTPPSAPTLGPRPN